MTGFLHSNSFIAALIMGLFCPVIGRNLIVGRSILLGLALPQVSLTGIAFLFLGAGLGWNWCRAIEEETTRAFIGGIIFTLPTLLLMAMRRSNRGELSEATLGFVYLAAVGSANLMLSANAVGETYITDLFHGRLLLISDQSLATLAVTLIGGFVLSMIWRRRLLLSLIDPDFALVSGVRVRGWNVAIALINGCVIGISVATIGPLVTFGFLLLPGLIAAVWTRSLRSHLIVAMVFGGGMAVAGFTASYQWDFPLGDSVVVVGCTALLLAKTCSTLLTFRRTQ